MGFDADSGPNLLLDWQKAGDPPHWITAGLGSIVAHAILVPLLIFVASLETPAPRLATEIVSNIHSVTLIAPPRDLTQKAPNRAKVAKEVNVEDLMPRPASESRMPPAPAVRTFRPPVRRNAGPPGPDPTKLAEPPKLDASNNAPRLLPAPAGVPEAPPPRIQSEEQPKLAFETPGRQGTSTDPGNGRTRLTPPKVEDAIHNAGRSGGQGGVAVTEIVPPPSLPGSLQLSPSLGKKGSPLELLSDPMGVDFKPYLTQILATVRRNWFTVIPESARHGNRGVSQLQFVIDRDGQVPKLVIAMPSGSQALDRAAVAAVSASVPFPPLPPEYKGLSIRLQFAFKYNVQ